MSRVALAAIPALTFYDGELASSRRKNPIPQLTCKGKPCSRYRPDVVRCVNAGGHDTDVDWKCETDLPDTLRLGRVEVSCEGWSGPGDTYVYKESCGLEYRLVEIPKGLRNEGSDPLLNIRRWDLGQIMFYIAWLAILLFIVYKLVGACLGPRTQSTRPTGSGPDTGSSWRGWYPPDNHNRDPPPPYSKHAPSSSATAPDSGRLGFWSGAALGGLGTYFLTRPQREREPRRYDWERDRASSGFRAGWGSDGAFSRSRVPSSRWGDGDRGEGSSNLGSMRRSTGFGGSNVR
ncbi:hypothetical protein OF83DRAFT_1080157 [Amylostereum chailletii]|nr:hypothetical protein OF83DRAFT_1080157 [Amylostereum chailletii]